MMLMLDDIDSRLSMLLNLIGGEEYIKFINDNEIMKYYDDIMADESINDYESYFTYEQLNEIYDLIDNILFK